MPMILDRLNDDGNKTVSIQKGPDTLTFEYNRKDYTVEKEANLQILARERRMGEVYAEFLDNILIGWDVVDFAEEEDRKKTKELIGEHRRDLGVDELKTMGVNFVNVPLSLETLTRLLGVDAVITLVNAIGEDNRPNPNPSAYTSDI